PAPAAPQAELLLAHQHGVAAQGRRIPEQLRNRLAGHDDIGARLQMRLIPEIAHDDTPLAEYSDPSTSSGRSENRGGPCLGRPGAAARVQISAMFSFSSSAARRARRLP